jgi:hypothetical protein
LGKPISSVGIHHTLFCCRVSFCFLILLMYLYFHFFINCALTGVISKLLRVRTPPLGFEFYWFVLVPGGCLGVPGHTQMLQMLVEITSV